MQNNRVWQRASGLTRTVVEGVHVDDKADAIVVSVRLTPGHGAVADCAAVDQPDRDRVPRLPTPYRLALLAHHNSQAETDPRIQQESDIKAHMERYLAAQIESLMSRCVAGWVDRTGMGHTVWWAGSY